MLLNVEMGFRTEAVIGVLPQEAVDEVFGLLAELDFGLVEEERSGFYVVEHLLVVFVVEGRVGVQHLED